MSTYEIPFLVEDGDLLSAHDVQSAVSLMELIDWSAMTFAQRSFVLDYLTDRIYEEFGPDGDIKDLGYSIDDAQWIVWNAYERVLTLGKIEIGAV